MRLLAICLLMGFMGKVYGQERLIFQHLSHSQGLPDVSVLDVTQGPSGFLWFATKNGLARYDGATIRTYYHQPEDSLSLPESNIRSLHWDDAGRFWIGTRKGFCRYISELDRFLRIEISELPSSELFVKTMTHDRFGRLWLGTSGGLLIWNPESEKLEMPVSDSVWGELFELDIEIIFRDQAGDMWIGTSQGLFKADYHLGAWSAVKLSFPDHFEWEDDWIQSICQDRTGNVWIGTRNHGAWNLQVNGSELTKLPIQSKETSGIIGRDIRDICEGKPGEMWIGALGGLTRYRMEEGTFTHFSHQEFVGSSLANNAIKSLFADRAGTLWIGSYYGGVNALAQGFNLFRHYQPMPNLRSLSHEVVSSFVEDGNGIVWVGTEAGGLNRWDLETDEFEGFRFGANSQNRLPSNNIKSLALDPSGNIWVGTFQQGLYRFNPRSGLFQRIPMNSQNADHELPYRIYSLYVDGDTLWVGTYGQGLWMVDLQHGKEAIPLMASAESGQLISKHIRAIHRDHAGRLWFATEAGLEQLRMTESGVRFTCVLPGYELLSLYEDIAGRMWLGTFDQGVICYDAAIDSKTVYQLEEGLPSNTAFGILGDDEGGIWVSSPNGIAAKFPEDSTFTTHFSGDHEGHGMYNYHAYQRRSDGHLMFGGIHGFTVFDPAEVRAYRQGEHAQLVMTKLTVRNREIQIQDDSEFLPSPLDQMESLSFGHNQASFALEFALLDFVNPENIEYGYQLEGLDETWTTEMGKARAIFTIQNPGTYTLNIRARHAKGKKGYLVRSLQIVVLPPWWRTNWAYALYFGVMFAIAWVLYLVMQERVRLRQVIFQEQLEIQKQEELNETRQQFFTNVTHEFRTPLTLILGTLEEMMSGGPRDSRTQSNMTRIRNNARRLLNLVTELMTLARLESGHMKLELARYDVATCLSMVHHSFADRAFAQEIRFEYAGPDHPIWAWLDLDKFEKILFNLLSNAFKFTQQGGTIRLSMKAQSDHFQIAIEDSGVGISENDLPYVFDRYFSKTESDQTGTGIGLALTRQLVDMHGGVIRVESRLGVGTEFILSFPYGNKPEQAFANDSESLPFHTPAQPTLAHVLESEELAGSESRDRPKILIVEDHPEVRTMLRDMMSEQYDLEEAQDGQSGFAKAKDMEPDLILTDVMMPVMNGLELCEKLKQDLQTSHIPVLMLSAKAELPARIAGLKSGADDYLAKPFSPEELKLKVQHLIENRRKLQQQFVRVINLKPKDLVLPSADETFLEQLTETIEAHLWNPDFNVNELALNLAVSRPILFKKIKALTGQTPKKLINSYRLKRAAQLLKDSDRSVSEIAYSVGFRDPKYFSRLFKEQYEMVPQEFAKTEP
ncbi:two-component regulator propeller domain-containing protein [Pontibacter sp. G13]|uniref:hybrid sensor histidine kinase/response regulator transcription factor n=1 Tax=Pontibacter sp. G13 TaxID=3074898 RepID=UPI0028897162|nr:two-component regulator propeller domain-containing protein [Pontibacter sp. G13]WNJ21508.1 two-component regulator propeller domain-containing protein [Pontibacter sp. G13]